jgi:hypothetical protein
MKTVLVSLLAHGATVSPALAQDADSSRAAGDPIVLSAINGCCNGWTVRQPQRYNRM